MFLYFLASVFSYIFFRLFLIRFLIFSDFYIDTYGNQHEHHFTPRARNEKVCGLNLALQERRRCGRMLGKL